MYTKTHVFLKKYFLSVYLEFNACPLKVILFNLFDQLCLLSQIILDQSRWSSRGIKFMTKSGISPNWEERINLIQCVSSFTHPPFQFLLWSGREVGVFMYSRFWFSSQYEVEKNQQQANPSWSTVGDSRVRQSS